MEIQAERRERTFIKLIIGGLAGLILVIVLGYVGLSLFHGWQERRLVRRAAAYLSGGDTKAAALSARRAFQMNPGNTAAARVLAQIAEREGDQTAVVWWRKVIDLQPQNTEDTLALARSALTQQDVATAEKALKGLDEAAKQTAGYHAVSARLEELRRNPAEAESHWLKATEIEPDSPSYQFQLASIRLGMSDEAKRELARQSLLRLRANPSQRVAASRVLILDAMARHEDVQLAQLLASELQGYPEALFDDRLLYLETLRQSHDQAFTDYLMRLEQEAAARPVDLASLLTWMSGNETATLAVEFIKTLPAESLNKWPVLPALAATYASLKDWSGLEQLTRTTEWPPFDFLRHAYLSKALREQNKKFQGEHEWKAATKEALGQPQSLLVLTQIVTSWGWDAEKVELLWLLAKNDDTKLDALQMLYHHYMKFGDTAGLYRALLRLVEALPNDLALQNNSAQVSLLLGTDVERANSIAANLNDKEPGNGAYAATYAFSLYTKGDVEGALRVMDQLRPEQLRDPTIAVYYGVVLAANGKKQKAREYLQRATEANLLPEERTLVAKAQASIE